MEPTATIPSAATALDLVIIAGPAEREAIVALTHRLDATIRVREPAAGDEDPHVIAISLDAAGAEAPALLERHARRAPSATIVALASRPTPDMIVRAMRAGANEVLSLPLDELTFGTVLAKIAAVRAMRQPSTTDVGHVTTVVAAKEGLGATSLVANLGVECGRTHPQQVALVDLDLRNGDLALLLNVDPPQSLVDLALGVESLDAVFVHGSLVRHPTGVVLLAASTERTREAPALTAAHIDHVLTLLQATHRVVLVDAPPPLSDTALAAARRADRVLVPTEPTVPCLRATWRLLEALGRAGIPDDAVEVVVTRYEADEAQIALDEIADALGRPIHHVVPREDDTACRAVNSGLPIASVRADGPLQHAIAALAATILPSDNAHPARTISAPWNTQ